MFSYDPTTMRRRRRLARSIDLTLAELRPSNRPRPFTGSPLVDRAVGLACGPALEELREAFLDRATLVSAAGMSRLRTFLCSGAMSPLFAGDPWAAAACAGEIVANLTTPDQRDTPHRSRRNIARVSAALGVAAMVAVTAAVAAVPRSQPTPLPLSARVIEKGEFPGFGPFAATVTTTSVSTARRWVSIDTSLTPAQVSAQTARLVREGFRGGVTEQLGSVTGGWSGISWVVRLRSAASARSELTAFLADARQTANPPASTYAAFAVGSMADARGFHLAGSAGNFEGDNVIFADGPYLYLVGDAWPKAQKNAPPRTTLVAAATKLHRRVHPTA
jgi:hypothetical protein